MEKTTLLALASDLKRVCQSIQRDSHNNADRFNVEAKKWLEKSKITKNYSIKKLLNRIEKVLNQENDLVKAENCLMYSVLLQNRAVLL